MRYVRDRKCFLHILLLIEHVWLTRKLKSNKETFCFQQKINFKTFVCVYVFTHNTHTGIGHTHMLIAHTPSLAKALQTTRPQIKQKYILLANRMLKWNASEMKCTTRCYWFIVIYCLFSVERFGSTTARTHKTHQRPLAVVLFDFHTTPVMSIIRATEWMDMGSTNWRKWWVLQPKY